MASKQEIEKELKIALEEIGEITPWYNKHFKVWVFSHDLYPVECAEETAERVVKKYPLYLKEFIKHRLNDNLAPFMENKTKGRGGKRPGAGRPTGSTKEPKTRIYIPTDIAEWLKDNSHLVMVRNLMNNQIAKHF